MASRTNCAASLNTLRHQLRQPRQAHPPLQYYLLLHNTNRPHSNIFHPFRLISTAPKTPAATAKIPQPTASKPPPLSQTPPPAPSNPNDPPSKNVDFNRTPSGTSSPPAFNIRDELRKRAGNFTEPYIAYGMCDILVQECASKATYTIPQAREKNVKIPQTEDGEDLGVGTGWWYEGKAYTHTALFSPPLPTRPSIANKPLPRGTISELGLIPTFNTWAQITMLHMYLLTVRMRCFPPAYAPIWHQQLLDHFFYMAEDRMLLTHNVSSRTVRNKYLKDLFVQWRGLLAAYDEGLMRGDAVLAAAVWRNVWAGREDVDFRGLGAVVGFIRGGVADLGKLGDEAIAGGDVVFGDPGEQAELVKKRSRWLDRPFEEEAKTPGKGAQG
ncbi:Protein cbp3, mitochondrial [Toensbergia leucococca]|nr:Protein cbp3, mitochondrial [Toensbergia leucococca]